MDLMMIIGEIMKIKMTLSDSKKIMNMIIFFKMKKKQKKILEDCIENLILEL